MVVSTTASAAPQSRNGNPPTDLGPGLALQTLSQAWRVLGGSCSETMVGQPAEDRGLPTLGARNALKQNKAPHSHSPPALGQAKAQ
jgi:hypothetical protein